MPEIVDPNLGSGSNANDITSKNTTSNQDPDGSHHSQVSHYSNPYIVGSPVAGSEMFFGREDVFEFIRQNLIGQHRDNVIVLYGQLRSGKTSVLRQMHSHLNERYLCIFIDLQSFELKDLNGFLWQLANNILRGLRRYNYRKELPSLKRDEFMTEPEPRSLFENEFLNQVRSAIGNHQHILLMLDEIAYFQERVQEGDLKAEIFGYIRHLMQHYEWLNFLFSLGCGIEEMQEEYAFLLNVGVYKKISFLDRYSASNLIIKPVKDYYQVEPVAIEHIFYITSGHPYYTQLLCHCLFNSWQQKRKRQQNISCINIKDVDEVLDEVMERGSLVLQDAWGRLTPGEKVIVAGMAAAMDESNRAVDLKDIHRAWERCHVIIPEGEIAQAIRSLIARDVITGQGAYTFTVDLQRLWVQKHQRLEWEWVKEEIKELVKPISEIVNPFIAGNPVTGSEMFFGREDVFEFVRQTLIGQHRDNVIVLYGQLRTGKTSVLRQMHSRLNNERYLCIFIDLHSCALESLDGFLWELANDILYGLSDYQIQLPALKYDEFMTAPRSFFGNKWLSQVRSFIGDRHILLMLDEVGYLQERVQKGYLKPEIFRYIRHLTQRYEWLNFLFSLGCGIEEIRTEYAFLFNVGLYKEISFLESGAARNLITQPVKNYYEVEPAAVEHILQITSGHPYYTQLLCHCLFNYWQKKQKQQKYISCLNIQIVDEVLNEATGLGSAVLQDAWGRLTPGEKVIVAGMAAAMDESNRAVDLKDINLAWERYHVVIPKGKMAQAIRSLIACDVITGQGAYTFTVDLQRLWVQKYQSIELVKEEIKDFLEPPKPIPISWPPGPSIVRLLMIAMVLLLICISILLFYTSYYLPNLQHASATATAQAISIANANATIRAAVATLQNPYPPHQGTLALDDPLYDNSHGYNWDQRSGNDCQFPGDGYHVATAVKSFPLWCAALTTNFSNFIYQAQMTISKGDSGGLIFRADADNSKLYDFSVDKNGYYYLSIYTDNNPSAKLQEGLIPSFHKGLGQSNLIAVMAQDDHITLYVNLKYVTGVTDANLSQGQIGVEATEADNPTEVIFTDAKVWRL